MRKLITITVAMLIGIGVFAAVTTYQPNQLTSNTTNSSHYQNSTFHFTHE